jgi:hypothetical protein
LLSHEDAGFWAVYLQICLLEEVGSALISFLCNGGGRKERLI